MDNVVSVTLIPSKGINVNLKKESFSDNFIDKAEEFLDTQPVGSSVEVIYDHIKTFSDGSFRKVENICCTITQIKRGVFNKSISHNPPELSMKALISIRARKNKLKKQYIKSLHK